MVTINGVYYTLEQYLAIIDAPPGVTAIGKLSEYAPKQFHMTEQPNPNLATMQASDAVSLLLANATLAKKF